MVDIDVNKLKKKKKKKTAAEIIFYCVIAIPPFIQCLIYYFGINLNSIALAFEGYDEINQTFYFAGFSTMINLFVELFAPGTETMWLNGVFLYVVGYFFTAANLLICFFLYKKIPFSNFFKVMLFLPSTLTGSVMVLFYKEFMELAVNPTIITSPASCFWMCWLYGVWIGFGGGMILYCGMFSRIDGELVDAIRVDGGGLWQEFKNLAWPKIYPIVTISIYTGLGGIFSATPNTYLFFGNNAPKEMWTLGYYMYCKVVGQQEGATLYSGYCVSSAANLMFGLIVLIPTFALKGFFEKRDPNN